MRGQWGNPDLNYTGKPRPLPCLQGWRERECYQDPEAKVSWWKLDPQWRCSHYQRPAKKQKGGGVKGTPFFPSPDSFPSFHQCLHWLNVPNSQRAMKPGKCSLLRYKAWEGQEMDLANRQLTGTAKCSVYTSFNNSFSEYLLRTY